MARREEEVATAALFAARAEDARGAPVVRTAEDRAAVREIVRLVGGGKVAVLLAAARADVESPAEILAALRSLARSTEAPATVREAVAEGRRRRLAGDLAGAERALRRGLSRARGDLHVGSEGHVALAAVLRSRGDAREALGHAEEGLALARASGVRAMIARAEAEVGTTLAALGQLRSARGRHERAVALFRELGLRKEEGSALSHLGVTLHRAGLFAEAERAHAAALAIHRRAKHRRLEGAECMHLGYVAHELGEVQRARTRYRKALVLLGEVGDRALVGVAACYLGALEAEAGSVAVSGPLFQRAFAAARASGSPRLEATTRLHVAEMHLALGERAAAEEELAGVLGGEGLDASGRAWALALAGRMREARAAVGEDAATRRAIEGLAGRGGGGVGVGRRVRLARRIRERAAQAKVRVPRLAADGTVFVSADGARVDLGRRAPLRRVLARLAAEHAARPGAVVPWEELLAHGWAGQRVMREAGSVRVRNAMAQLRGLGLRGTVLTREGGYALEARVRVVGPGTL